MKGSPRFEQAGNLILIQALQIVAGIKGLQLWMLAT
jgi:hypothetical protein